MILHLAKHETAGGIEGGVYYFNVSNYPVISTDELKLVTAFINYEKLCGRQTEIVCDDGGLVATIRNVAHNQEVTGEIVLSETTEFVYHATNLNGALGILSSGKLLSAVNVYNKTGEELAYEKRDSPWNDPADFFEYIMFCNGNDMTGDYVVLSDSFPDEHDMKNGRYNAGVRFYIRSDDISRHPRHIFDGYHPIKVKGEIILSEYLFACIAPEQYKENLEGLILPELAPKVHYLSQWGLGFSEWNDKVYTFVSKL